MQRLALFDSIYINSGGLQGDFKHILMA